MKIALDPYMFRRVPHPDDFIEDDRAGVDLEDRARESCQHSLQLTREYLARYSGVSA